MVTANTLFLQRDKTKDENAKRGINIYFNKVEKTSPMIYKGIYPNYKKFRNAMNYFGQKLSAEIKKELIDTDFELVRGNEMRVNFAGQNTTTDFAFVLNNYITKKPVIITTVSGDTDTFVYTTSKFDSRLNDYIQSSQKNLTASNQQELIEKVIEEVKSEIKNAV